MTIAEPRSRTGLKPGTLIAITFAEGVGVGLALRLAGTAAEPGLVNDLFRPKPVAPPSLETCFERTEDYVWGTEAISDELFERLAALDQEITPRWVMWSQSTAAALLSRGLRCSRSWDIAAVHRLLVGGWTADPAHAWAHAHNLAMDEVPELQPHSLFNQVNAVSPSTSPVDPQGYLEPHWAQDGWASNRQALAQWARLGLETAGLQLEQCSDTSHPQRRISTARSESTIEVLCAELAAHGLPFDRAVAERNIESWIGPRPATESELRSGRQQRDNEVLSLVAGAEHMDLRSPGQVKSLLRRVGIELPDTRAWRLETARAQHPVVEALFRWRKAERIATTYGYQWLDEHLRDNDQGRVRLHGNWSGSDGAAGRMTASAGLHNMPADMRVAVRADPGWKFVRSDLGQIEPRILAAVSGDAAFLEATRVPDLYQPVATSLGVDRATAKLAVLGAMYGQTTGHGATALHALKAAYPGAIAYLDKAAAEAQGGNDLRTHGGRLIRMHTANANSHTDRELRSHAAARGRYGRNAMIQGAAAEFFKVWALLVRSRTSALGASIVLCLHDELLVHTPEETAEVVASLLEDCLQEAAARWAAGAVTQRGAACESSTDAVKATRIATPSRAHFFAETTVVESWDEAGK